MKTYQTLLLIGLIAFSSFSKAYLPPTKMILNRLAENNGNGVYQIEQELQFATSGEPITIREIWISEGDKGLRLIATGQNELKDKFKYQALYVGGQKWTASLTQKENQKIPSEMTERPFHQRTTEGLTQWLIGQEILPGNFLQLRGPIKDKEGHFSYPEEPFLRLSRAGGTVNYALGTVSTEVGKNFSGLWVEQDQFLIRKVRWPNQSEMSIEEIGTYARGLIFPKTRSFRWGNQSVQMRTISVIGKSNISQPFQVSQLEANRIETVESQTTRDLLTDFYQRFR
jgi:hypothetical protein